MNYQDFDTPEARRFIDRAREQDEIFGLNGSIGELLVLLKVMVWGCHGLCAIPPATLDRVRAVLSQAEVP
jgi:hypothetical protein